MIVWLEIDGTLPPIEVELQESEMPEEEGVVALSLLCEHASWACNLVSFANVR